MHCLKIFQQYKNKKITYDTFISMIKNLYIKDSLAKHPPDDNMILSSLLIIQLLNRPSKSDKLENLIALASFVFRETGDEDIVLLLLSIVPARRQYLRRIFRTYAHLCLVPFLRQELINLYEPDFK